VTELYGWRYVFLINVPLGIVAFVAIFLTLPETDRRSQGLDWIGLLTLALGVASFQLMLDRGERNDWFDSWEIIVETGIAVLCVYLFVVHSMTTRRPFLNMAVFRDRNYVVGLCLIFIFGITVFASMFLLPLFLQNVQGYPVLTAGWVLSARGVGTMAAMMVAGPAADRISPKYLIWLGLATTAFSNAWMTTWNQDVAMWDVVWVTVFNGFGMGLLWVALSTVTFSTLAANLRTEGAALFALVRAVGASMGTSIIVAVFTRYSQTNYVTIREHVSPYNEALGASGVWDLETLSGLLSLRDEVVSQAETIAYLNDFILLVATLVAAAPLVFLLKSSKQ
jgi:DHA2 family multidrug resistance protein